MNVSKKIVRNVLGRKSTTKRREVNDNTPSGRWKNYSRYNKRKALVKAGLAWYDLEEYTWSQFSKSEQSKLVRVMKRKCKYCGEVHWDVPFTDCHNPSEPLPDSLEEGYASYGFEGPYSPGR